MQNGKGHGHHGFGGDEEITRKGSPVKQALLEMVERLRVLANGAEQVANLIDGITGPGKEAAFDSVYESLRRTGDGLHDSARGLKQFRGR